MDFSFAQAFSRTVGWVTPAELATLRSKRVAIAGLGGVGGSHLLTLTRLGIGRFAIADFDTFELANFNRQAGATMSSVGHPKIQVLARAATDINPELELTLFADGVDVQQTEAFLRDCDLYVDGLDFFAFGVRRAMFAACRRMGIPAVTVAPLGMGAALVNFLPDGMGFDDYFGWDGCDETDMALRFVVGLAPAMLHRGYLVDASAVDLAARRGPSTPMACELCAGVAATEALKILLRRGKTFAAPWAVQFDAYSNRLARTWRPGGFRNPLQRLAVAIGRRQLVAANSGRPAR